MSDKKNGNAVHIRALNKSADTVSNGQPDVVMPTGSDDEDIFKGFEMVPKVLIKPINISPLCNFKAKMKTNGLEVHYDKLINKQCIVKVRRDNLLEVKRCYENGKHSSFSPSTPTIKCKICEKVYCSEKKLQNHLDNKHKIVSMDNKKVQKRVSFSDQVIIHEVKEYHSCRKCTKIFENYKSLKTHMKLKHRKRKCYICHYCSKDFIDRMFFKLHIKLHCDRCGLLFPSKKLHAEHKRTVCKQKKQYKCKTCNEIYFHFMDLKDHSYEHIGTFFICDICKDQFSTKCEVAHHISFLHTKKRPTSLHSAIVVGTDKMYHCNFCNKSFSDVTEIESHTGILPDLRDRIMTGYKDHNFCDMCLIEFSTVKEMLQHKWTHFLKKEMKTIFKLNEIPEHYLNAKVKLTKLEESELRKLACSLKQTQTNSQTCNTSKTSSESNEIIAEGGFNEAVTANESSVATVNGIHENVTPGESNEKPRKKPRKILFSKHQCQNCLKYFSSGYCLRRHIKSVHSDFEDLQCRVCEEVFVWPSLLINHKCIRLQHPEMPFDDARPEIQFDNLHELQNGFDDLSVPDDESAAVDFEIPAPIVSMTESETPYVPPAGIEPPNLDSRTVYLASNTSSPYTLIMHEVPIEF